MLGAGGWIALFLSGFIDSAPNRLAHASAQMLWQAPRPARLATLVALALTTITAFIPPARLRAYAALLGGIALFSASLYAAGLYAAALSSPAAPAARQSLGLAAWTQFAVALFVVMQARSDARIGWIARISAPLLLVAALLVAALSGWLDKLSLAQEFSAQRASFTVELLRHLMLVGASLFFALVVGVPLTLLSLRKASYRAAIFASLNILQTIPSIAIFGLLIAPLSMLAEHAPLLRRLGISGTGATPAIIALTLYALLPLVRNFATGIAEVPADVKDAARGLGFDRKYLFLRVELPLALPALIAGLRVVTVQSIGLATFAALIGAGGLGTFVFDGIGQYAPDLVLVGTFPVILLALAADRAFRLAQSAIERPA
jgi:osmoprotectant transport system permease protein